MAPDDGRRARQPAAPGLIGPRVVEHHAATDGHESMPAGPVELTAGLGMIAVDEHNVHRDLTSARRHLAESATCQWTLGAHCAPRRRTARATTRRVAHSVAPHPLGSASGCAPKGRSDGARRPARALAQRQRRGSLIDADLDHPSRATRRLEQHSAHPVRSASCVAGSGRVRPPARAGADRRAGAWASDDAGLRGGRTSRAHPTRSRDQTAETCSSSATLNEEPQPQAATTLGFDTLKPAPCRLSS